MSGTEPFSLRQAFADMVRIRSFEEKVLELRLAEQIAGSVHLCIGQEAIPVGACAARRRTDPIFATYRGHGWAIACGASLTDLFGELLGRDCGVNGGRGGSAYLSVPEVGFFGENSIVGAGAPIATGAALAARYDRSNRVAITVFGDGALNQGSVHESFNFAAALALPVVFICENNHYSELTPISAMVGNDELYKRADGYGMRGVRIDGNDPDAVRDAVDGAIAHARANQGPTLIEAMTDRLVGHYIGDAQAYRPAGEIDALQATEPVGRARRDLVAAGATKNELDETVAEVRAEVGQAAETALAAPLADVRHVKDHLYA